MEISNMLQWVIDYSALNIQVGLQKPNEAFNKQCLLPAVVACLHPLLLSSCIRAKIILQ